MNENLSPILRRAAETSLRGTGVYDRVRLPWWKAILKRKRYELREVGVLELMMRQGHRGLEINEGINWREVKLSRFTEE